MDDSWPPFHLRKPWISLDLVDVELPDGQRFEQHVVRMARPVAGAAVIDEAGRVLLMWRHRHITDTWGWEIPTGRVEDGESPEQAAAREVEEETGWRPGPLRLLVPSQPSNGSIATIHYLYRADGAELLGPPADRTEAERIDWIPLTEIQERIEKGEIVSGPTLIALLYIMAIRSALSATPHPPDTEVGRVDGMGMRELPTTAVVDVRGDRDRPCRQRR